QPAKPLVTIELTPSFSVVPGQSVLVHVTAASLADIRPEDIHLTLNGVPVALDASGRAQIKAGNPGRTPIEATATDLDGLTGGASTVLKVRDPNDVTTPRIALSPALINARLTSTTPLVGSVVDASLDEWELEIARADSDDFHELASGHANVTGGVL